jgi:hypothetical protein
MSETAIINTFFWVAMLLLVAVTSGVGYLTFLEWRDRRRKGK